MLAAILWAGPPPASATTLHFSFDTSALAGAAHLAFDFIDGDGVANNTVTVSNFYTGDVLEAGSAQGAVTGTLAGSLTLNDIDFGPDPDSTLDDSIFNEFLQPLTLGRTVRFTLDLTEQAPVGVGSTPDSFAFFLLDAPASSPRFATTDPTGAGALFAVDIDGTPDGRLYTFAPTGTEPAGNWTVTAVPLPSTAWLLGAGVLGGLAARRRLAPLARRERGRG